MLHLLRAVLLLAQSFPALPLRPLSWLTRTPEHRRIVFDGPRGQIVGDLFVPSPRATHRPRPAIILATGVRTLPTDRLHLLGVADAIARLGYAVLWPRSQPLEEALPEVETPETFIAAVDYLQGQPVVDPERVSLIGFSAGASVAFVAAAHPAIATRVRALVFFGGFCDVFDYVRSLATRRSSFGAEQIEWHPSDWAILHVRGVLRSNQAPHLAELITGASAETIERAIRALTPSERALLERLSPAHHLDRFRARIFIVHDQADPYVPYLEARKLAQALPARVSRSLLITQAFEHTLPRRGLSWATARELARFLGMLQRILAFL